MATSNSNCNTCGCTDTYVVTTPCPPSCPEVFNAQCIVYTGTDVVCNQTTVISRYDYLDTVITKLVNFICNTNAPVTVVVGSTYIDVVPNTVGNITTYTVSVDIPALQAYFDTIISQTIAASILAGPGINVVANPFTGAVTISHADTSSVANVSSDNSGNTFIQDVFFTFDTFGHVTGASVVPASIIEASLTSAGGTESLVNDGVGPTLATKGLTAGTGISLSSTGTDITITNTATASSVTLSSAGTGPSNSLVNDGVGPAIAVKGLIAGTGVSFTSTLTDITVDNTDPGSAVSLIDAGTTTHESLVNDGTGPALATKGLKAGTGISLSSTGTDITITNTDTGSAVTLASAGGSQTLVNDGTGPSLATKGLTAGNGINLFSSATAVTIATLFNKFAFGAIAGNQSVVHGLGTLDVIVSIKSATLPLPFTAYIHGTDYTYVIDNPNQITITDITGMGAYTVTIIG